MMLTHFWSKLFLWILIHLVKEKYVKSMPPEDFPIGFKDIDIKKGHVACQCGKPEKIREKDLDIKTAQKLFLEISKDKGFLEKVKKYSVVKEFIDCLHCTFTFVNCPEDICVKKVIKFSLNENDKQKEAKVDKSYADEEIPADFVPKIVEIPIGGHKNHSRIPRFVGCSYPNAMETAAISCRVYPSSIKCVERCAFGYTLDNGIQRNMQCNFKDKRWSPSGFKECLPFVDCSVTLSSGGAAKCSTASVENAPVCKIECTHYEDKPAIPMALYTCKIDGTWDPPLPFCAMPGSGLVLVSPPKSTA